MILIVAASMFATFAAPSAASTTVWAVGDGAYSGPNDSRVVDLIESRPHDRLLYLGDVYETGTAQEYEKNYAPTYGRLKSITKPVPGNHEYPNHASGYDPYWGSAYSNPHYYSFDVAGWHMIALNSEEPHGEGSPQLSWLRSDIAKHSGTCTIAFWHRPRYSSGLHGDQTDMAPAWAALVGHARLVLSGHDHDYERFRAINGITQFVVGTGGEDLYPLVAIDPRRVAATGGKNGALELRLSPGRASYAFFTTAGTNTDSGKLRCPKRAIRR